MNWFAHLPAIVAQGAKAQLEAAARYGEETYRQQLLAAQAADLAARVNASSFAGMKRANARVVEPPALPDKLPG